MIAENLQHWAGLSEEKGRKENANEVGLKLIALGSMSDDEIADISGLTLAEVRALRKDVSH